MFKITKRKAFVLVTLLSLIVSLLYLQFIGFIWFNALFASRYPVKGLDVSHHQGEIDWHKVAATKRYSFVYIKATEGHDFFDDKFLYNWHSAKNNGLRVGAYHFFSMRSPGQEQANYFISIVPKETDALPPVLDVEVSLDHDPETTRIEISNFLTVTENYYLQKPILYVTYATYSRYVENYFDEYPIWIRDVLTPPRLKNRNWLIWQYNNRGHVYGIDGYVDINVLNGDTEKLK